MGISQHHAIPSIMPSFDIPAGASGNFTLNNGKDYLGEVVGGIINGIEKVSFYINVTALSGGTLTINVDSSLDGKTFTTGGQIVTKAITAIGQYQIDYNGTPKSILRFSYSITAGDTATVENIGLEGSLS